MNLVLLKLLNVDIYKGEKDQSEGIYTSDYRKKCGASLADTALSKNQCCIDPNFVTITMTQEKAKEKLFTHIRRIKPVQKPNLSKGTMSTIISGKYGDNGLCNLANQDDLGILFLLQKFLYETILEERSKVKPRECFPH